MFERFVKRHAATCRRSPSARTTSPGWCGTPNTAFRAIADESASLDRALELLPDTLRKANTTFVNLRATLDDLDKLVDESKPATRDLAPFLRELRPLVTEARPTIADLRHADPLAGREQRPDRADRASSRGSRELTATVFPRAIRTLDRAQPVFEYVRGYTPDLAAWLPNFGQLAASYDANGHYARVQPMFLPSHSNAGGTLTANQPSQKLDGFEQRHPDRCPGGIIQPPPDGSAPLPFGGLQPDRDPARPMRRLVYICLFVAIAPVGRDRHRARGERRRHEGRTTSCGRSSTTPPTLVEGEDVKVAGVPVGAIERLDVTEDQKAALTLRIDNEDFTPWKADASCTIRPQSLIGEKFVECEPGLHRAPSRSRRSRRGAGEGERLLPVENTSSPVDLDLINNILRLPYRERFGILLSEFGTGLAGRGEELNEVIHRANPALRETDRVLAILAEPEPHAGAPGARLRPGARPARPRAASRLSHWIVRGQRDRPGVGRAQPRHPPRHQPAAGLPARAAPPDGRPGGARRAGHAAAGRPRARRRPTWTA